MKILTNKYPSPTTSGCPFKLNVLCKGFYLKLLIINYSCGVLSNAFDKYISNVAITFYFIKGIFLRAN